MSETARALDGVKVISFGAFVAGNTAAKLFTEMGADVVKVEARRRPEVLRTPVYSFRDPATEPSGAPNTVMYAALSRGVRNLSIDLQSTAALSVFHRLVAAADVVIENFGPTTLDRLGCGYDDLVRSNPRLVMLSLSGYGRTGPRAGYLGYATTIASYVGLSAAWQYTHGTLTDYVVAATGVVAALAALQRARSTGAPAHVDVGQIDAMAPILAGLYAAPLNLGYEEPGEVNRVAGSWLSGLFAGMGYEAWLAVDIEDGEDWAVLCEFLERPDLATMSSEEAARLEPELRRALTDWVSNQTPYTAMRVMQKAGLAAAVVQTSEDLWRDPQLHARGFPERVEQPDVGSVSYPRSAQRWTKTPGRLRRPPARLGQHTNEVLREWIGLSDDELAELSGQNAIFDAN